MLDKTVRMTLGTTDELTLIDARKRADELLAAIKRGEDPTKPKSTSADHWTVEQMYAAHVDARRRKNKDQTHSDNILANSKLHLADWQHWRIRDIKPDDWKAKYDSIHADAGQWAAYHTLKQFRAAYNHALKQADNLPADPSRKVDLYEVKAAPRKKGIAAHELPGWFAKLRQRDNMLALLYEFALFCGARSGHLGEIRREWIDLPNRAIRFPKLKADAAFDLPMSGHMIELVNKAIALGDKLHPAGTDFLFPNQNNNATVDWRMKGFARHEKGHDLRSTYITLAQSIGMNETNSQLLTDHTVPGVRRVYINTPHLFAKLLEEQERMTKLILSAGGLARAEGVG